MEKLNWTIGHSTHPFDHFLKMLQSFEIGLLIDVRKYPGSRRYPQYNKETLEKNLTDSGIRYLHMDEFGGRRKPVVNSHNTAWRNDAFRAYADYMETPEFQSAIGHLENLAAKTNTVYMCSEAVWWSCHRSLISDYLKIRDWKVMHITAINKATEHPYTSAAKIVDGELSYRGHELF